MSNSRFGLISVPHDRFFLVSDDYETLKITQLIFMKNDLFYLVDISRVKEAEKIDDNIIKFSMSGSSRLHLEPDVETKKLPHRKIINKEDPSESELKLKSKVDFVFGLIKTITSIHRVLVQELRDELAQETQGLNVTKKFFRDTLGEDSPLEAIIDRDLQETLFPINAVDESKNFLLRVLANIDYDLDLPSIKNVIQQKIKHMPIQGQGPKKIQKITIAHCK